MIDHYKILEVQPTASPEVIEKAYKALSLKHHPDRRPAVDRDAATRMMQQLNESYAILSDPVRRREYDGAHASHTAWREEEAQMFRTFLDDGLIGLFRVWIKQGLK